MSDTLAPIITEGYEIYVAPSDHYKVARNAMYLGAFQIAKDHFPIGVGFGLFGGFASQLYYSPVYYEYGLSRVWGLSPEYSKFLMDAFWPHIVGEFGILGLLALLCAFYGIWRPLSRAHRASSSPLVRALSLAAVFTFAEAMVESGAESIFEMTLSCTLVFGLAALATALARRETRRPLTSSAS